VLLVQWERQQVSQHYQLSLLAQQQVQHWVQVLSLVVHSRCVSRNFPGS
jgi:hypothetical protein